MISPRSFILENSEKFEEAVMHGYDIRMDEHEIFEWMDSYATYAIMEKDIEIQSVKRENEKLRELIEICRRYASIEYAQSASCRVIYSEIQQVFPKH